MRIDLPTCGFKNCRFCFDGNCTSKLEYEICDYARFKTYMYYVDNIDELSKYKADADMIKEAKKRIEKYMRD